MDIFGFVYVQKLICHRNWKQLYLGSSGIPASIIW